MTLSAEDAMRIALAGHFYSVRHSSDGSRVVDLYALNDTPGLTFKAANPGAVAKEWSQDEDDSLRAMRSDGMRWSEIGRAMGVSTTLCWRRGAEIGLPAELPKYVKKPWNAEDVEKLAVMVRAGMTRAEMAKALDRSPDSIHRMVFRLRRGKPHGVTL